MMFLLSLACCSEENTSYSRIGYHDDEEDEEGEEESQPSKSKILSFAGN